MTCTPVEIAGAKGFVCTRSRTRRCGCGKPATKLCDFPVTRRGRAATCDRALCEECAQPVDTERDYCPAHDQHARQLEAQGDRVNLAPVQRDLFTEALARRTDADSSHEAADRLERSGARQKQLRLVEALVWKHPGLTTKELARTAELDRHMVGRRMSDLVKRNRVHRTKAPGEDQRCWPGPKPDA